MARTSPPLKLEEADRPILEAMSTANGEQGLRARIVLACAGTQQIKDIASSLDVSTVTVSKWKEAYRIKGLDGIRVRHSGGRPSKYTDLEDLTERIVQCAEEHPDWKADDVAKTLNIPSSKVHYELGRKGINLERNRSWTFQTPEFISHCNPYLLLIYRAYGCGTIVALRSLWSIEWKGIGTLDSRNRSLIEELRRSVVPVTLECLLHTAAGFVTASSGKSKSARDYVAKVVDLWYEEIDPRSVEFHIFSFGCNSSYQGSKRVSCIYHTSNAENEMVSSFAHWMGGICTGRQHTAVEDLMNGLTRYGKSVREDTAAFVWYSGIRKSEEQRQSAGQEAFIGDGKSKTEGTHLLIEDLSAELPNLTQSEYDELSETLEAITRDFSHDGPNVGAILYQADAEGHRHFMHVRSDRTFQAPETFDFSSKEGLTKSISRLEEDCIGLGQKVSMSSEDMYIDFVKKTKDKGCLPKCDG